MEARKTGKQARGFASMGSKRQQEIASLGGRVAHKKGTAHEWTSEEAREAGRKGGMAAHRNRRTPQTPAPVTPATQTDIMDPAPATI